MASTTIPSPSIISCVVLTTSIILNSIALSNSRWFMISYSCPDDLYLVAYGPTKSADCYYGFCQPTRYASLHGDDVWRVRLGGGLALGLLALNIVFTFILIYNELRYIFQELKLTKSVIPPYWSKIQSIGCLLAIPLQILSVLCWAVLFPYYQHMEDFVEWGDPNCRKVISFNLGTGLVVIIAAVGMDFFGYVLASTYEKLKNKIASIPAPNMNHAASIIIVCVLLIVIAFNIVAVVEPSWYVYSEYGTKIGLLEQENCNSGCRSYSHEVYGPFEDKKSAAKLNKMRAGGVLALVCLCFNIFLADILLANETFSILHHLNTYVASWYPPLRKYVCLIVLPLQVLAVLFWAALFPYYKEMKHFLEIGSSIIVIIVAVALCIGGQQIIHKMLEAEHDTGTEEEKDTEMQRLHKSVHK